MMTYVNGIQQPQNTMMRYCPACDVAWAVTQPLTCWMCGERGVLKQIASWRSPAMWRAHSDPALT